MATDYEIHPKSLLYRFCDWVGRKTGTIILTPHLNAVGNCAEDVYFGFLKARREGKRLFIIWPFELPWKLKFGLTNQEVVNVESEYRAYPHDSILTLAARLVLTAYFAFFRALSLLSRIVLGRHLSNVYRIPIIGESTLWHPSGIEQFSWEIVAQYDWQKQLRLPLKVYLPEKKKCIAECRRIEMGLPPDAWFVCLHVRESGFRDSAFYEERGAYDERNATIANYLGAMEEITRRGGWVVRMGDPSMTRLPPMDRVIDYPFTPWKSELMDVYLISECRLYIGMASGIYDVARLFQKPMIMTNMNNWLMTYPILEGDLGIAKHVFSKSKGRFLSLREWINEPWDAVSFSHPLGKDYVFYENSPEELTSVVREFFEQDYEIKRSPIQKEFDDLRITRGRKIISERMFFPDNVQPYYKKNVGDYDLLERYRLASRLDSAVGRMGAEFLRRNWEASSRNCEGQS